MFKLRIHLALIRCGDFTGLAEGIAGFAVLAVVIFMAAAGVR